MHTEVSIVAAPGRSPRVSAAGGIAVRQTGPHTVHLIGTAATPLGGDTVRIVVDVTAGARLEVRTVAAMIVLPSAQRTDSESAWDLTVGEGARLLVDPEPTVIAGGAAHRSTTTIAVAAGASVTIGEHAQIGRTPGLNPADDLGGWQSALHVDAEHRPLLRHRTAIGSASPTGLAHRGISSVFRFPDDRPEDVADAGYAARLMLAAGGSLTTALAGSAAGARHLCDELDVRALV